MEGALVGKDLMRVENIMLCGEVLVEIEDWRRIRENNEKVEPGCRRKRLNLQPK